MSPTRLLRMALLLAVLGGTLEGCGDDTDETTVVGGAPCGPATCAETEYCCFDECGLCAPQGVACPQTGCN